MTDDRNDDPAPGARASASALLADLIRRKQPTPARDLADGERGRSESTVARTLTWLNTQGLVVSADRVPVTDTTKVKTERGRPTRPLTPNPRLAVVGILVADVDNQPAKLVATAIDIAGRSIDQSTITVILSPAQRRTPDDLAQAIAEQYREVADNISDQALVIGLGVAMGGHLDHGVLVRAPANKWEPYDFQRALSRITGQAVLVDNDSTAFGVRLEMLGEIRASSAATVCVFGDGVGGSLVLAGRLWRGARGLAMEPGHIAVDPKTLISPIAGPATEWVNPGCRCGTNNCVEAFAAPANVLRQLAATTPPGSNLLTLDAAASTTDSDERVSQAFGIAGAALGRGIANIVNTVDPEQITIYAPPSFADPGRGSAAASWLVCLRDSLNRNIFTDPSHRSVECNVIPTAANDLERMSSQAAAFLVIESMLTQIADPTAVPAEALIDLSRCRETIRTEATPQMEDL